MASPTEVHIYFASRALYEGYARAFERRPGSGSGGVVAALVEGDIQRCVEAARLEIGGAPLGVITSNESDALEAIATGADDATPLTSDEDSAITTFLDRVRVRGGIRRDGEQQQRDYAQAEKLSALGGLVAGVGHELNNPLSTITLGLDILQNTLLPDLNTIWEIRDEAARTGVLSHDDAARLLKKLISRAPDLRELIEDMSASTNAVAQLVQDLRVFSRSNVAERAELFSPISVIEQALRLVRREFGPGAVIEQDYEQHLPQLCVPRNRLAQVITNLLVNAAHAIKGIEREIHQIKIGVRSDAEHIAIFVSDTGPGIPEEALELIFHPFFTTKREGMGTGLGLSISRSIIQQMGGDLTVSSVDGEGATFTCFIPLPTEAAIESAGRRRSSLPTSRVPSPRHSILLIDDDERVLRAASRSLRDSYKVLIARDGQEACELLVSGSHADAIVMELNLPEMDGPAFHAWLLKNKPSLARRLVVATATGDQGHYREFVERNSLPVVHKPIGRPELLQALADAMTTSNAAE